MLFFALCLAAIVTLVAYKPGRLHLRTKAAHLAVQYVPGIVGTVTTIWWTAVVQSYNRIIPYKTMASVPLDVGSNTDAIRIMYDLNALAVLTFRPGVMLNLLRQGHGMTFLVNFSLQLSIIFLTPLKGGFIQVTEDPKGWTTVVSRGIGYALFVVYIILLICTGGMIFRFWSVPTGLRSDPASIAAQLILVQRSNIFKAFSGMEFVTYREIGDIIPKWGRKFGVLRLGYWQKQNGSEIIHGVRFFKPNDGKYKICGNWSLKIALTIWMFEGADFSPTLRYDRYEGIGPSGQTEVHYDHRYPKWCLQSPYSVASKFAIPPEGDRHSNTAGPDAPVTRKGRIVCSPQYVRYRHGHPYLHPWWYRPIMIIAVICVIVSIPNIASGRIHRQINLESILTANPTSLLGRFEASLFFSTLPALLFSVFNITFVFSSLHYRLMQPIRGMDTDNGASPRDSILVDYISPNPFTAIYKAIKKRHYRVAWQTQLALWCTSTPIVAARIFVRLKVGNDYVMAIQPIPFYVSFALLCFYCGALWYAIPPLEYRAPRTIYNLVDTISLCYQSSILDCKEFSVDVKGKTDTDPINAVKAADRRFQFGLYLGLDDRRHIGFDVAQRRGADGSIFRPVDRFVYRVSAKDKQGVRRLWRPMIVPASQATPQLDGRRDESGKNKSSNVTASAILQSGKDRGSL